MNLRVWHQAAVWVVVLGPVLLCGVACRKETLTVQVQDIESAMDGASVRVEGVVVRYPTYDPVTERLTFWVDDGTGQVFVVAERSDSRMLFRGAQVPTIGDRVGVTGNVQVRTIKSGEGSISLALDLPELLHVERPSPPELSIADALRETTDEACHKVVVRGLVREVWEPYRELTILRIQDWTGEIDVIYDQDLINMTGAPTTVYPGDSVSVRGAVVSHRGQAQLVLDAASGLVRLPADALDLGDVQPPKGADNPTPAPALVATTLTPTVSIATPSPTLTTESAIVLATATPSAVRSDSGRVDSRPGGPDLTQTGLLSETFIGRIVTVEARIVQATLLSAGCKSVVDDSSGPTVVWMPNALYGQLVDPEGWNVGGVVRVTGLVSEYDGELELVPQRVQDVVVVARASPMASADIQIGSLSGSDVGRRVTVAATIVTTEPFSAGVKCLLDDGSGQVVLLLWQNVFEAFSEKRVLAPGTRVLVTGWVDEYRGELEVIPGLAYDVVVLGAPDAP